MQLACVKQNIPYVHCDLQTGIKPQLVPKSDKLLSYNYGLAAEKLVISYLKQKNYNTLHHRHKTPYGEIDIVAYNPRRKQIVFVEVKARRNKGGSGLSLDGIITAKQQARYLSAIEWFIGENIEYVAWQMRIDCVIINGRIADYIENCWQ